MNIEEQNDELPTEAAIDGNTMLAAGWISVDNMPPPVTPVLVFGWCCDICHNIKIAEWEDGVGWWESGTGDNLFFKVVYWQRLPFPAWFPSACG